MSVSVAEISRWEQVPEGHLALTIVPLAQLALSGVVETPGQRSDVSFAQLSDRARVRYGWTPHTIAGVALSDGHVQFSQNVIDLIKDMSLGMTYEESARERHFSWLTQKSRGARLTHLLRTHVMSGVISKAILMDLPDLDMQYSDEPLRAPLPVHHQALACGLILGMTDQQIANRLGTKIDSVISWKNDLFKKQGILANDRGNRNLATRWAYERRLFVPLPSRLGVGLRPGWIPDAITSAVELMRRQYGG